MSKGKQNNRPGRLSTSTKDIKDPRRKSKDHVASPKESELFAFKSKHYRSLISDSVQSSSKRQKLNSDSGQSSSKRQKLTSRSASEIVSRKSGKKESRGHSIELPFHRPHPLREARPLSKVICIGDEFSLDECSSCLILLCVVVGWSFRSTLVARRHENCGYNA